MVVAGFPTALGRRNIFSSANVAQMVSMLFLGLRTTLGGRVFDYFLFDRIVCVHNIYGTAAGTRISLPNLLGQNLFRSRIHFSFLECFGAVLVYACSGETLVEA